MQDHEVGPARRVAPGGIRRLVVGFACGVAAGALVALVLPRDDGPRRRRLRLGGAAAGVAASGDGRGVTPSDEHRPGQV